MKVEETRPGVFAIVATAHELSALLAGARMSVSLMETDPSGATEKARQSLEAVLADFDRALSQARGGAGGS
jgi:predicted DNA-binding transcriptional regulator YafY